LRCDGAGEREVARGWRLRLEVGCRGWCRWARGREIHCTAGDKCRHSARGLKRFRAREIAPERGRVAAESECGRYAVLRVAAGVGATGLRGVGCGRWLV